MSDFALLGCFAVCGGCCLCWYRLRVLERTVLRLEDRSARDYETGLRSARLFDEDAAILCRTPCRIAVLLVEVDGSDRDAALGTGAKVLEHSLRRQSDRLYRRGPWELLVLLTVNDAAESFAHAQRLQVALGARRVDVFIGIAFADPDAPDTGSHNRRTSARLLQLATTNLAAAKKRSASRIYPPLFLPNDPPAVVATVVPPKAIDWERTERMVVGDPLPQGQP
ncbi:MAG: GGDEF domain-containing protein [Myxococcales bacterium]|nr:GGDEF domain-containing protein [Myxococcales bacterium]